MNPTAAQFHLTFTILLAVCGAVAAGVLVGLLLLVLRFHERRAGPRRRVASSTPYEVGWTIATFFVFGVLFVFGARSFRVQEVGPEAGPATHDVLVTGKRWMWRFEQPDGVRELDELHVPVGRPIRLHMTSQDVIHSFFVPEFRIKHDVLPGRTTTLWFEAPAPGVYPVRCAEYCGLDHSRMSARIVALEPDAFARWEAMMRSSTTLSRSGAALFDAYGCADCHHDARQAPALDGIYRRPVRVRDGRELIADDAYLRESILAPTAAVVTGYEPSMPSYAGRLSEHDLTRLVLYLEEDRP